ncbi:MAG TPA: hypothetical protein VF407_07575 [Polyangiaceae bacterium]
MLAPLALLAVARKVSPGSLSAQKIRGAMRVVAYFGAVSAFALGYAAHVAKADVAEEQMTLGRDLMPLADLLKDEHTVLVNGEHAHVSTATTTDDVATVLDRFQASCEANASPLADGWKLAAEEDREKAKAAITGASVMRQATGTEGTLACIAKGARSGDSFLSATHAFAETGDLGSLGQVRYVYVQRGSDNTSFVLTAWTDASFSVKALTPKEGEDAPGTDSANAPRPPHAQRILATAIEKTPFVVRAYTSTDAPASVLGFYDAELPKTGWTCGAPSATEQITRSCTRGAVQLTIVAGTQNGKTLVSITEALAVQ